MSERTHSIVLGKAGGKPVGFDLDVLLRTRLLIQANSGGGKSWAIRRIAEQAFGKLQVLIIDPEGEFATLREKYGYVLVGEGGETPADVRSAALLAERLLELRASAVCDLYEAFRSRPGDRRLWVRKFLEALIDAPKKLWRPLLVVVDEAHKFCPQETPKAGSAAEREGIIGCKDAMISLATTGRKRSFCSVWATQRLAKLDKDASSELLNRLVGLTFEDVDIDRAIDLLSVSRDDRHEFKKTIRQLEPGHFYALGRAISKERIALKVGPVQTTHPELGSGVQASGPPPPPDKVKALLPKLKDLPKAAEEKAKSETELKARIRELEQQTRQRDAELIRMKRDLERKVQPAPLKVKFDARELRRSAQKAVIPVLQAAREIQRHAQQIYPEVKKASELASRIIFTKLPTDAQLLSQVESGAVAKTEFVPAQASAGMKKGVSGPRPSAARTHAAPPIRFPAHDPGSRMPTHGHQGISREGPFRRANGAAVSGDAAAGDLGKTPRQMLQVLASWTAAGRGITRGMLAASVGVKADTGSFRQYLSALRTAGFLREEGELLWTSEAGMDAAGEVPQASSTTEEVVALWKPKLGKTPAQMLDALVSVGGESMSREDLAQAVGLSHDTGSFRQYLSALRTAGLLVDAGGGAISANRETLFL